MYKSAFRIVTCIGMLLIFALTIKISGHAVESVPGALKTKILSQISGKLAGIYDADTGLAVDFDIEPGQNYILAVNITGLSWIRNTTYLYLGTFRGYEQKTRYITFRWDVNAEEQDWINIANWPDSLRLWPFTIPDNPIYRENNVIRLNVRTFAEGGTYERYYEDYYNLIDTTPDMAWVVNPAAPMKIITVKIGYLGNAKTDEEISAMLTEIQQRFLFATKQYVHMAIDYIGRQSFPEDNAEVAGMVHDYLNWWNGVSHDLTETNLLPLDPANPQDMEMIKLAWYDVLDHRSQLRKDIIAIFGLAYDEENTIIIVEGSYWAAGGAYIAKVPVYNSMSFSEIVDDEEQWGIHEDFGSLSSQDFFKIVLHEFGHVLSMDHPPEVYSPTVSDWTFRAGISATDIFCNLMHQGELKDYPTDRFYTDHEISYVVSPLLNTANAHARPIPVIRPVGDPLYTSQLLLEGDKLANASIKINGPMVVAADPNTYWSYTVSLDEGVNRFDISQSLNGDSHPYILYVTRETGELPEVPVISLSKLKPQGVTTFSGGMIHFELEAQAAAGLRAVWWWAEKEVDNGQYQQVQGVGHWRNLYGAGTVKLKYETSFLESGLYRIMARARDGSYPMTGEQHQSNISVMEITVE